MTNFDSKATPRLTLTPNLDTPAPSLPVQEASSAPEAPALTPEEEKMVQEFAEKIDLHDSSMVLQYGAASQQSMAQFSESALKNVRTKDLGEVGQQIADLVVELQGFSVDQEENKGIFGFFKRSQNKIASLKARYDKAEVNMDKMCEVLEEHQTVLLKDIATYDRMYEMNLVYFKELSMYILAGKQCLEKARQGELKALRDKAQASKLPEDAQAANDFAALCERFEKKLHDLDLTRTISMQMAPQLRLIQNNDQLMAEKIQSTLVNTIPLWKSQMLLALGMAHAQQAMEAQRAVTDMTNQLLRKNAEALKQTTVETAKEAERGIVDIETLTAANQTLISTLDEVLNIQQEGRQRRHDAELELRRIEDELRNKLLEVRN